MHGVSLLWALRSPCNLGCRYCYFGTIEEHRQAMPAQAGMLSHLARTDLELATIAAFVQTLPASRVERIFLAGGEPLIWPPIMDVVAGIKAAGVQVVLCTNGIPLNRPEVVEAILTTGVDAVSVSLDSADPDYNDRWRPARNGQHGHGDVVAGIQALITARGDDRTPRVGIYSVITRQNIDAVTETAALAARLGCDYFVPQPIALEPDHALHQQLSLTPTDAHDLDAAFAQLYAAPPVQLPAPSYPGQVVKAVTAERPGFVRCCFGGTDLFFIEPDGSVWDCPSGLKIHADAAGSARRSIRGASATTLFGRGGGCADCHLFSADCVNMWPLMGFAEFLPEGSPS
ncbi:radical SAM protein [Micromonospora schwarzwaldensis]|uniref:radical SAM protein n=1 Tax=Micromonospora sp. DSM 45708 TaxID=3111767 RepID=UPI0031DBF1D1